MSLVVVFRCFFQQQITSVITNIYPGDQPDCKIFSTLVSGRLLCGILRRKVFSMIVLKNIAKNEKIYPSMHFCFGEFISSLIRLRVESAYEEYRYHDFQYLLLHSSSNTIRSLLQVKQNQCI